MIFLENKIKVNKTIKIKSMSPNGENRFDMHGLKINHSYKYNITWALLDVNTNIARCIEV